VTDSASAGVLSLVTWQFLLISGQVVLLVENENS
jgi:hypothetical protein